MPDDINQSEFWRTDEWTDCLSPNKITLSCDKAIPLFCLFLTWDCPEFIHQLGCQPNLTKATRGSLCSTPNNSSRIVFYTLSMCKETPSATSVLIDETCQALQRWFLLKLAKYILLWWSWDAGSVLLKLLSNSTYTSSPHHYCQLHFIALKDDKTFFREDICKGLGSH